MTDPLRPPGKTPRRAEPVQPDRPGRGTGRLDSGEDAASGRASASPKSGRQELDERMEQSKTALDNVRHP
jgi:hypothetical protein